MAEDDHCDIDRTKDRQLVRLLEEAAFALEESAVHKLSVAARAFKQVFAYTERFLSSLMALISIFLRPMMDVHGHVSRVLQTMTPPATTLFDRSGTCLVCARGFETTLRRRGPAVSGDVGTNKGPAAKVTQKRSTRFSLFNEPHGVE
jgi:hypothetical protein